MPSTYGILIKNGVNYSHDTAESISFDNTESGLTATNTQDAIDELTSMIPAGSGGHTIINDSGTSLAQKDNLQFKGVYTQNNGDNTEVNICRTMTKAQMEALSGEELKGFINTSDEPDSLPLTAEWVAYDSNTSVKDKIDDIDLTSGGTIDGALQIHGNTIVENSGTTDSYLLVGGSTSRGLERIYKSGYYTQIYHLNNLTANRELYLPDKTGTLVVGQVAHFNCTGVASTSHSSGWHYADYEVTLNKTYGSNAVAIVTQQRGAPFIDQADITGNKLYIRIWSLSSFGASTSFAVNVFLSENDSSTN